MPKKKTVKKEAPPAPKKRRGRPPKSASPSVVTPSKTPESVAKQQELKSLSRGAFGAIGDSGLQQYGGILDEEFLTELIGIRGYRRFREMRDNDAVTGAMLFGAKQLIKNAHQEVVASSDDPEDQRARNLIDTAMNDMVQPWNEVLDQALTCMEFGFSFLRTTLKNRRGPNRDHRFSSRFNDGLVGWRDMTLLSQDTLDHWIFDEDGFVKGWVQDPPQGGEEITIPIDRGLHFRTLIGKESPEGQSVLRRAFRAHQFKKRMEEVEGIGFERELTGLPVLIPPEGLDIWNTNNPDASALLTRAQNVVRSLRRDQHEGLVLPFGWTLDLMSSAGSRTYNTSDIISRWDSRIAMALLADMILIGHERVGSFALVASKTKLFSSALQGFATIVEEVFNRKAIPRLLVANGMSVDRPPQLKFGPIETPSIKELGEYVWRLARTEQFNLTDEDRRHLRQIADMPPVSEDKLRELGLMPGEGVDSVPSRERVEVPEEPDQGTEGGGGEPEE
jgi:hypothetical protein